MVVKCRSTEDPSYIGTTFTITYYTRPNPPKCIEIDLLRLAPPHYTPSTFGCPSWWVLGRKAKSLFSVLGIGFLAVGS